MSRRTMGDRIFGWGRLPADLRSELESEGMRFCEEGVPAMLTVKNFRAPGRMIAWRRQAGSAALGISAHRLVASLYRHPIIHLRFDDPRFTAIDITRTNRGVEMAFDAERLDERRSGYVAFRLRTDRVDELLDWIAAGRRRIQRL